ncbi:cytochrome b5-related protein-like [Musca vetustissima]|uniref:cytochrome b5-related protein-like n=1 Tax=Musca vetustissima TaxID=27455 RepID=UPI002AB5ECDC|nr:cytochrome b5-related protein-like [Musca vetustissima]
MPASKVLASWKNSTISVKPPSYRNKPLVTNQSWLKGKQHDDNAEGLWRIYDNLYDFTDFISKHPGGSFWLEKTKGTDITESFETHHIKGVPQAILEKYFIRKAKAPRNYTLTLHENGFYRTLKKRVAAEMKHIDQSPKEKTRLYHLLLLSSTLLFVVLSALLPNIVFEVAAALSLAWVSISAHNYFHQRDNWQMYTFNLTLMNFNEWRISHALSHHVYTNSLHDLEMSLFEPFLCWIPNPHIASMGRRIISVIIQPVFYAMIFPFHFILRVINSLFAKNVLYWHDVLGFTIPLLMLVVSQASPLTVLIQWLRILAISSFIFGLIGLNASHHTPEIVHDGDALRENRDWGLYQLDTIIDRGDIKSSQFMCLTHFGEHSLHHLFPTLDHGILPQLNEVFLKTLEEFKSELREISFAEHIIGQNKQLLRTAANPIAVDQRKSKK